MDYNYKLHLILSQYISTPPYPLPLYIPLHVLKLLKSNYVQYIFAIIFIISRVRGIWSLIILIKDNTYKTLDSCVCIYFKISLFICTIVFLYPTFKKI